MLEGFYFDEGFLNAIKIKEWEMHQDFGEEEGTSNIDSTSNNTSFVDDQLEEDTKEVLQRSDTMNSLIEDEFDRRNKQKEAARAEHEARKQERKQDREARRQVRKEMESKERAMTETEEDKLAKRAEKIQKRLENETSDQ